MPNVRKPAKAARLVVGALFAWSLALAWLQSAAAYDAFAGRPSLIEGDAAGSLVSSAASYGEGYFSERVSGGGYGLMGEGYGSGNSYGSAANLCPQCEDCPHHGVYGTFSYDAFRAHPDGSWMNNGLVSGVNYGTRLGPFSEWTGIGFQIGTSVGVFDWSGTDYRMRNTDQAQMQGFVTTGFFRRADDDSPWTFSIVNDWMFNSTYSVMGENPTLAQWRGSVGYTLNALNEVGFWGAFRGQGDTRLVGGFGDVTWRPVQHYNAYYKYRWPASGADTFVWFGVPENDRLRGGGSLGDYSVGALTNVPLSDRFQLYGLVTYMHPSGRPGPSTSLDEAWCFSVGFAWYLGRTARSATVAGQCWLPLVPVANNGTFLVDASDSY